MIPWTELGTQKLSTGRGEGQTLGFEPNVDDEFAGGPLTEIASVVPKVTICGEGEAEGEGVGLGLGVAVAIAVEIGFGAALELPPPPLHPHAASATIQVNIGKVGVCDMKTPNYMD